MTQSTDRRRPCYVLVNVEVVQAAILPVDPRSIESIPAELREISQIGAKVLISGPPKLRYECRISLFSHRLKPEILLPAEIHWARPNPAGDWLLGCHFKTPLCDELLQQWINSGVLNRRKTVRERSRIYVGVQLQTGTPRLPAIVNDLSEGGICLITSEAPKNTREIYVFGSLHGQEVQIPLKVRWNLSVGPKHMVGCEFAHASDYQILRRMHLATQQPTLTEHSPAHRAANRLVPLEGVVGR